MDDIKVFAKNEKELKSFIQTIRNFSEDIGMKFVIEKYYIVFIIEKNSKEKQRKELNSSIRNKLDFLV